MGTIARNEITGRVIKTDPPTQVYRDRLDLIYATKSSNEWLALKPELQLINSDGWDDKVTLDTPIKYKEFLERLEKSEVTNI